MAKFVINNIKKVSVYRWVLSIILFIAISNASFESIRYYQAPTYYNVIINQFNLSIIGFALLYIQLILVGDIYSNSDLTMRRNMIRESKQGWLSNSFIYAAILCLIVLFLFLLSNLIIFLLRGNFTIIDFMDKNYFAEDNMLLFIMPIILIYLRLLCMCFLVFGVNLVLKNPLGFIIPLFISLGEWVLERTILIKDESTILPINNTQIIGNENISLPLDFNSFLKPIIYWLITISLVIIIINIFFKFTYKKEMDSHEEDQIQ